MARTMKLRTLSVTTVSVVDC